MSTETLADHAEGLLGESEAGRVQAHLDDCEACRSEAMLLISLQEILRADEVGPMPAEYATRIDVVLADLAAAEPVRRAAGAGENLEAVAVLNAPVEGEKAEAGGAKIIDLATRRKVMVTGLRRVGTVAAGVVLLIGGAALGVQTLGNHTDLVSPGGPSTEAIAPARSFDTLPTPPKTAVTRKHGIKVDEQSGWIYMPNGKVLLPDGTVVLPGKHKSDPPTVIAPKPAAQQKPSGGNQTVVPPKPGKKETPPKANPKPVQPQATTQPVAPAQDPADPGAPEASAAPAPQVRPATTKAPNNVAPNNPDKSRVTTQDAKNTYVSQSGSEYTQDNFANKVMDLLTQASHDSPSGSYTSTSAGGPQTDPNAGPTTGPTTASPSVYPQNMAVRYQQVDMPPAAPGRGPAAPEVKYRVQRCARQLGQPALAGDEGMWAGHKATIVVVPAQDNANQVIGYVFYGNCSNSNPATEDTAQWEQRVNKPAPQSNPDSTPVPRVGGTSPDVSDSRSESVTP